MKIKFIFSILLSIIIGYLFGQILFNQYNNRVIDVFNEKNTIYFLQQGVYSNKETMETNTESINNYIYVKKNNHYKVYVGITGDSDNAEKLKEIFVNMGNDIYVKEENISNLEFIETLKQYDNLLKQTSTDTTSIDDILMIEKQVLSKYEELVLKNE
ncbi:MAG: hypothetical protein WDA21_02210 [Bacilli bacterium]